MKYSTSIISLVMILNISCSSVSIPGPKGPIGPMGVKGDQGPKGEKGEKGEKGKTISKDNLLIINKFISEINKASDEFIIGSTSYSFGFAPKVTGFVYLTNKGHLYKLDSKNPKTLGQKTEYITRIEEKSDFTSISKTAYGEDIKQYFTSTTKSGDIYFSEDLKDWNKLILKTLKD